MKILIDTNVALLLIMINNNNEKQFDCITMKRNIQKRIYDETKNMTTNELLRYFNDNGKRVEVIGKNKNA